MKSQDIRFKFFNFFGKNGHEKISSSSLIPAQDPTLLFTNAGMNQFKDLFLGLEKRTYSRAVSIQKCVRAGGKHNDLNNVGFTKRHLTFFEMMGNFSFNDYFKKEAIQYAWDFLTKELHIPTESLHATVFETDIESYNIWQNMIGIPIERIHKLGKKDNFWSMGDLGPCGPCTEIHIDRGVDSSPCPDIAHCSPACDCDRFLEIWNVVFMQYDQQPDGTLKELAQKGVDTGMGLERLTAVLQHVDSVYHTDLFMPLIRRIEEIAHISYRSQSAERQAAFHVLADHARCVTMLIADSCIPSNDGRGYVLRKIIRRAALFAQKLSTNNALFPDLCYTVVKELSPYYPSIADQANVVHQILTSEIEKFVNNLVRGTALLNQYFVQHAATAIVSGKQIFMMYDTYGFPIELIHVMAHEHGFSVDEEGYTVLMAQQQAQSGKKTINVLDYLEIPADITTTFTGYDELETVSVIRALVVNNVLVDSVVKGQRCYIIAEKSPFFIVGGGQVPDTGTVTINNSVVPVLSARFINGRIAVEIDAPDTIRINDSLVLSVNQDWRTNAMNNHTATHLLQAALINVLGAHIKQAGSLVHPDYLRFDFSYHQHLSIEQIQLVENLVNEKIRANIPVNIAYLTMKEAVNQGALAFFGDKYNPEKVRMVAIDQFSKELCGGTHVPTTGVIGAFKIIEVSSPASGQRRIVAVTGASAIQVFQETFNNCKMIAQELKTPMESVLLEVTKLKEQQKECAVQIKKLKQELIILKVPLLLSQRIIIHNIPLLIQRLDGYSALELKEIAGQLEKNTPGCYALISLDADKKVVIVIQIASQYSNNVSLADCSLWLKNSFEIKSGGTKLCIQGNGVVSPDLLITELMEWFTKHLI